MNDNVSVDECDVFRRGQLRHRGSWRTPVLWQLCLSTEHCRQARPQPLELSSLLPSSTTISSQRFLGKSLASSASRHSRNVAPRVVRGNDDRQRRTQCRFAHDFRPRERIALPRSSQASRTAQTRRCPHVADRDVLEVVHVETRQRRCRISWGAINAKLCCTRRRRMTWTLRRRRRRRTARKDTRMCAALFRARR